MISSSIERVAIAAGAGILTVGVVLMGGGIASATFPGANDAIAFYSSCSNIQAIYSVPNGTTMSVCPGTGTPAYTQSTSGSIDAMPFFSSDGGTLYFESNRPTFGSPWAIYSVAFPSTPSSPVNTLATPPSGDNDFAPTVTADSSGGSTLDFLQCVGTSNCTLEEETLSTAGVPTESPQQISTGNCPAPVGPLSTADGQANRPEFNPTNPNQLVYVGQSPSTSSDPGQENIYLLTNLATPSSTSCVDLSNTPTIIPATQTYTANTTSFADQDPDWSPDGTQIVFDSNRTGGDKLYEIDPANNTGAYQVWGGITPTTSDPGEEVEPVYAPSDTPAGAYPKSAYPTGGSASSYYQPTLVWVYTGGGANVQQVDNGTMYSAPTYVTADYALNVDPIWQPIPPSGGQVPEAPFPALLVGVGLVSLAGGLYLRRRRVVLPA